MADDQASPRTRRLTQACYKCISRRTSAANRAKITAVPAISVRRLDPLTLGNSHQPNTLMNTGIVSHVVAATLITLPMNIAGDRFSAADVYVGSHLGFGMQFGTVEKRKVFEDYWARLAERPAYKRGVDLDNAAMPKKAG